LRQRAWKIWPRLDVTCLELSDGVPRLPDAPPVMPVPSTSPETLRGRVAAAVQLFDGSHACRHAVKQHYLLGVRVDQERRASAVTLISSCGEFWREAAPIPLGLNFEMAV
jgi:hypothetical protein